MNRRSSLKLLGAGATAGLAGCTGGFGGGSDGVLKVGGINSLTGPFQAQGEAFMSGFELATRDYLAGRGGIDGDRAYVPEGTPTAVEDVDIEWRDSETSTKVGVRKARQLIEQDDIDFLQGGLLGSVSVGLASLAKQKQVLSVTGTGSMKVTGSHRSRYLFSPGLNSYSTAKTLRSILIEEREVTSWDVLYQDYVWGQDSRDRWVAEVEDAGGSINLDIGVPKEQTDYNSQLSRVANSDADGLFLGITGTPTISVLKQAAQYDLQETKTIATPFLVTSELEGLNASEVAGVHATSKGWFATDTENNRNFVSRFYDEYEMVPSSLAYSGYKGAMEVYRAIERAGTKETEAVVDELEQEVRSTYFKDGEQYFRACDHQLVQTDSLVVGGSESASVPSWLPDVSFPVPTVDAYAGPEDGIFRECGDLPETEI
jgi:branched-chain amino acid transport system substrate-binding protein